MTGLTTNTETVLSNEEVVEYYGEKPLRWFQVAARNATIQALQQGKTHILIVQPTGSGKTLTNGSILMSEAVRQVFHPTGDKPLRVLFLAHKTRLLTQAEKAYTETVGVKTIDKDNLATSSMMKREAT